MPATAFRLPQVVSFGFWEMAVLPGIESALGARPDNLPHLLYLIRLFRVPNTLRWVQNLGDWLFCPGAAAAFSEYEHDYLSGESYGMHRAVLDSRALEAHYREYESTRLYEWELGLPAHRKSHWTPEDHSLRFCVGLGCYTEEHMNSGLRNDWTVFLESSLEEWHDALAFVLRVWLEKWAASRRRWSGSTWMTDDGGGYPFPQDDIVGVFDAYESDEEAALGALQLTRHWVGGGYQGHGREADDTRSRHESHAVCDAEEPSTPFDVPDASAQHLLIADNSGEIVFEHEADQFFRDALAETTSISSQEPSAAIPFEDVWPEGLPISRQTPSGEASHLDSWDAELDPLMPGSRWDDIPHHLPGGDPLLSALPRDWAFENPEFREHNRLWPSTTGWTVVDAMTDLDSGEDDMSYTVASGSGYVDQSASSNLGLWIAQELTQTPERIESAIWSHDQDFELDDSVSPRSMWSG